MQGAVEVLFTEEYFLATARRRKALFVFGKVSFKGYIFSRNDAREQRRKVRLRYFTEEYFLATARRRKALFVFEEASLKEYTFSRNVKEQGCKERLRCDLRRNIFSQWRKDATFGCCVVSCFYIGIMSFP